MRFSSLAEWLGWLEQSHPKEIDLGLERIRQVAARLGLLQPHAKIITVAGTNGKGSCVTACAGLLGAANFSVGVYTSPHLLQYNERIQINGKPVNDAIICAAFEKIADAAAEISLTYFEYGTLAALYIFNDQHVDFMVLEVGLGGRLDAVNILDADVAVITSIALDHQDWLGDNRELIGREKAGILRAGKLFICADDNPPQSILEHSSNLKTISHFIERDFSYKETDTTWEWQGKDPHGDVISFPTMVKPHLPLPSLAAALQAIDLLDIKLPAVTVETTLLNLYLPGRFQKIMFQQREFILDVAHNPAATAYFAKRLRAEPFCGKTYAIVAMMADKDRVGSLVNLEGVVDVWYLLDLANNARAATSNVLTNDLAALHLQPKDSGDVNTLITAIMSLATDQDRIVVFGSFYTVAAVLSCLQLLNNSDPSISRGIV